MTVLGDSVTVLGDSVSVEEPELGSEVSGVLEVLGDTESEGLVDDDEGPLQPDSATANPAAITSTLLRSSTTPSTNETSIGRAISLPLCPYTDNTLIN